MKHRRGNKNTLMSTSDELGPSISCWKMEEAHPMSEEMDGKAVCFPPGSAPNFYLLVFLVLLPIWTLSWRVSNYVFLQGKGLNWWYEFTRSKQLLFVFWSVVTIISSIVLFFYINTWIVKKQIDFLDKKANSVLMAVHYFSRKKWQVWGSSENLQPWTRRIARNIPGVTWHKTQMYPDHKKILSLKFLSKLTVK